MISTTSESPIDPARPARITRLGEKISALSMRCWRTGWLKGTEFIVPELCRRAIATGMAQPWGKDAIAPDEASDLWALADELKCWVNLDDDDEFEAFDPFPIPAEYLNDIGETDAPQGTGE